MDPNGGMSTDDVLRGSDEEKLALMSENCLRLLDAGVTTARDLGSPGTFAVTMRDRIQAKKSMGPRLLVANGESEIIEFAGIPTSSWLTLAVFSCSSYHRTTRACPLLGWCCRGN